MSNGMRVDGLQDQSGRARLNRTLDRLEPDVTEEDYDDLIREVIDFVEDRKRIDELREFDRLRELRKSHGLVIHNMDDEC